MFPSRVLELLHLSSATGSYHSASGQRSLRVLGKHCWYVIRLVDKEWTHQLFSMMWDLNFGLPVWLSELRSRRGSSASSTTPVQVWRGSRASGGRVGRCPWVRRVRRPLPCLGSGGREEGDDGPNRVVIEEPLAVGKRLDQDVNLHGYATPSTG